MAELGFYLTLSNLVLANAVVSQTAASSVLSTDVLLSQVVLMPEVRAWRWWAARSAVVEHSPNLPSRRSCIQLSASS